MLACTGGIGSLLTWNLELELELRKEDKGRVQGRVLSSGGDGVCVAKDVQDA